MKDLLTSLRRTYRWPSYPEPFPDDNCNGWSSNTRLWQLDVGQKIGHLVRFQHNHFGFIVFHDESNDWGFKRIENEVAVHT